MSERARAELALIGVTAIWGSTFVVVKNALDDVSTLLFLAMRFTLATAVLFILFRSQLTVNPGRMRYTLTGGCLAGLCLVSAYWFQTFGLRFTTPSKSAFVTGLISVVVPILGSIVYRKAPQTTEVFGVAVATFGLALLTLPPGRLALGRGDALTLGCTILFAAHILVLGRWSAKSAFALLSVTQIGVTALVAWLLCGWAERPFVRWTPALVFAILVTALLATALAFTVQAWAQRHTTPTRAALIFALEPVSAAITSYFVAGETLTRRALTGAALILAGILLVELKPFGKRRHPSV